MIDLDDFDADELAYAQRRMAGARLVAPQPIAKAVPRAPSSSPAPPIPAAEESGVFRLPVLQPTRDQLRSRRKREVRKTTINVERLPKREIERGRAEYTDERDDAPTTRGDCVLGVRPCPYVSCAHHLYLDVNRNGSLTLNFPDLEPDQMGESCSLDIAEQGGATLEDVGALMNLTRERIRQIEIAGLETLAPLLREQREDLDR